jgi:hypothetical protein
MMTVEQLIEALQKIDDPKRRIVVYNSDKGKFGDLESVGLLEFADPDDPDKCTFGDEVVITLPYMSDEL